MQQKADYKPWVDVVLAMLSTGGYRLERTYEYREQLIKNGLTNPREISSMDMKELADKLIASGYDRGSVLTKMFAERLFSLGKLSSNIEENERILTKGTKKEVSSLLLDVKGIGPVVIEYYLILRDDKIAQKANLYIRSK